jgi:hypothetical protein
MRTDSLNAEGAGTPRMSLPQSIFIRSEKTRAKPKVRMT